MASPIFLLAKQDHSLPEVVISYLRTLPDGYEFGGVLPALTS